MWTDCVLVTEVDRLLLSINGKVPLSNMAGIEKGGRDRETERDREREKERRQGEGP